MAGLTPPTLIDQPSPPPVPYGLFTVAQGPVPFPMDGMAGGVQYVPNDCDGSIFVRAIVCPPITGAVSFTSVEGSISGAPFTVYSTYTCGSVGFSQEEATQRVTTRLQLRAQTAVEKRLWQGITSATDGNLTGLFANATPVGFAGCPTEAVEILEQTLADNNVFGGIIHARVGLAAHLSNNFLIYERGNQKQTPYGTPYVFGQGYSGIGPTGQAVGPDTEWMYASGRIIVYRDPDVWVPPYGQVFNRTTNQITLMAQQNYALIVECGVWAVQVTRSCTSAGGGT